MIPKESITGFVKLTRPQNVTGSLVTFVIGFLWMNGHVSTDFYIGLVILALMHAFATVQNDIEDIEIDRSNKRTSILISNEISTMQAWNFTLLLLGAGFLLAVFSENPRLNIFMIVVSLALSWLYNSAPVRASRRPVLSLLVLAVCYGTLPLVYGSLSSGQAIITQTILLAFIWFVFRFTTAILKDYKDVVGDLKHNKSTFYLKYGSNATTYFSVIPTLFAYIGVIAMLYRTMSSSGRLYMLALVVVMALISLKSRLALLSEKNDSQRNKVAHNAVFRHNQFELAILLCLILR